MIKNEFNPETIERAVLRVTEEIEKDNLKFFSWREISEEQLWQELVFCILGSRVKYETAKECTTHLYNQGLLSISEILESTRLFEFSITTELSKPIFPPYTNGRGSKYPFYKSKSQYIVRTVKGIDQSNFSCINDLLETSPNEYDAREKLTKEYFEKLLCF